MAGLLDLAIIVLVPAWFICAVVGAMLARRKGQPVVLPIGLAALGLTLSVAAGVWMGMNGAADLSTVLLMVVVLGVATPIPLIVAAAQAENREALEARTLAGGGMRKCPRCAELVKAEAVACRFCGAELTAVESGADSEG